ncbi:hypothetical protein [Chitinophaga sancti]|uniref:Uncharacterized protein n=1 Tax=Chitinophaga sancti TaxID=1004 RepID=A0A1K1QDB5_9BACT|nr:hypothetical protein [Chitinophaga sancti]WQD61406.1 hypothetical protein U0033_26375 [Chitinophaga sancti]WQG93041.1 hypothetical protein SR876_16085 [Chitinophaga sancti]SFW57920.1 hypothetical protein SAMN05661012_02726 [Chitinophaga sancti]
MGKRTYSKATKATLNDLKSDSRAYRYEEDGNKYGLLILYRGETLFYQENDRALLCGIAARFAFINPETIAHWDDNTVINTEERATILEKIITLYKKAYKDDLQVF